MLGQALELLRASRPARLTQPKDVEEAKALQRAQLLTAKPVLYVCNVDEGDAAGGNALTARVFDKAAAEGVRLDYREYDEMVHDWMLGPLPEAKQVLNEIVDQLSN